MIGDSRKGGRKKRPYSGQSKGKDWLKAESFSGLIPSSVRENGILPLGVSVVCLFTWLEGDCSLWDDVLVSVLKQKLEVCALASNLRHLQVLI